MTRLLLTACALALSATAGAAQQVPGAHFIENWDMDADGQVTQQELAEKRGELFYMFDQNEDGSLDDAEYTLFDDTRAADIAQNAGGPGGHMRGVDNAMSRAFNDADGDGLVTRDEFLARVPEWFAMMDRTGDGVVTTEDFGRGRN